jgi:hypothetical protein
LIDYKRDEKLTYEQLREKTDIGLTQLSYILKHSGEGVHINIIEDALKVLGFNLDLGVWRDEP